MSKASNFILKDVSPQHGSETLITGEITLPFLVALRPEALKSLGESASLPGFRPGKIPEDVLVKTLGEMKILEETAELALAREYENIIKEAKIRDIGRPEISITKMAPGSPLEFKIKVAVEPEFSLPDYKKIAKEILGKKAEPKDVTDKEVEDVVEELKKREIKPELAEGEKLEDKIRENLKEEKKHKELEGRRLDLIGRLVKETEITPPQVLIEYELEKMLAQFRADIERMGISWEEYLKKVDKTEEEVRKEWGAQALSRVKAELILAKIAEKEKIEPKKEDVEKEAKHLISHYPDADVVRAQIYVYSQLRNKAVFDFLETVD